MCTYYFYVVKLSGGCFFQETTVDPFKSVTIASACNVVYRKCFLKRNTVAIVPPNGYQGNDCQSRHALLWLTYMVHVSGQNIRHCRNGGEQEIILRNGRKMKLDGAFTEEGDHGQKHAYEFLGDYFNRSCQCTMGKFYEKWQSRKVLLETEGWTVHYVWECEFRRQLQTDAALRRFAKDHALHEPLNPRAAFFGGRTSALVLHYVASGTEQICYADMNSLYPYVNKYRRYPIGHPSIILGADIDIVNFKKYFGIAKCILLPPQRLYHPVLPARIGGKLKFVLCRSCAETMNDGVCNHRESERWLEGTWVTEEILLALFMGYTMIRCDEVWHFDESSEDLFKGYINKFLKLKQQARGWPVGCGSDEQKRAYLDNVFEKEGVHIDKDKVAENPGLYQVSKICLNSFWGKFGQRPSLSHTKLVDNELEFWQLIKSQQFRVIDVDFPSDQMAQMHYVDANEFVMPGLTTKVVIAAFTTAYARMHLHETLRELGPNVLYMDTDSVIFVDPNPADPSWGRPPMGDHLGVYKDEIGAGDHIVEFCSIGPKNYGYQTAKGKVVLKVRGFSLNYQASKKLNFATVRDMVARRSWDDTVKVDMGTTIVRNKRTWQLSNRPNSKLYRFSYDKCRLVNEVCSVPWGYMGPLPKLTELYRQGCHQRLISINIRPALF